MGEQENLSKENATPVFLVKIRIHFQEPWAEERKIPFCPFALPNSYSQVVQQQLKGTHNDIIDWNDNKGSEKSGWRGEWEKREVKMYLCYRQKTTSVPQQGQMKNQMTG